MLFPVLFKLTRLAINSQQMIKSFSILRKYKASIGCNETAILDPCQHVPDGTGKVRIHRNKFSKRIRM